MVPISITALFFPSPIKLCILDLAASRSRCVILRTFQKCGNFWYQAASWDKTSTEGTKTLYHNHPENSSGPSLGTGVLEAAPEPSRCACCVWGVEGLAATLRGLSVTARAWPSSWRALCLHHHPQGPHSSFFAKSSKWNRVLMIHNVFFGRVILSRTVKAVRTIFWKY